MYFLFYFIFRTVNALFLVGAYNIDVHVDNLLYNSDIYIEDNTIKKNLCFLCYNNIKFSKEGEVKDEKLVEKDYIETMK